MDLRSLIRKHSTAGPRYTSYPTAPQWSESTDETAYRHQLQSDFLGGDGTLGLYVHLPFCESLCYYCGCNIQITHDRTRSDTYVRAVMREIREVARLVGGRRALSQISWGGGTPTFLQLSEIEALQRATLEHFDIAPGADVSIEVDPRITTPEQLELLRSLGFTRVSLGVQDFEIDVQKAVNRLQSAELTQRILEKSRALGFRGINFDLIYGLPLQTTESFARTVDQLLTMKPDRIALYNYARLPGLLPHQKILEKYPMPEAEERVEIFSMAYERLTAAGFVAIGMDHFAAADDDLAKAIDDGRLYRNFMGYVVRRGTDLIGTGASAIGEVGDGYFQNVKKPSDYEKRVEGTSLATLRGCRLTDDDRKRKWIIQELMCRFTLSYDDYADRFGGDFRKEFAGELPRLAPYFEDGLLVDGSDHIGVTALGRLFIRNVAMVFDAYLEKPGKATYSKTV